MPPYKTGLHPFGAFLTGLSTGRRIKQERERWEKEQAEREKTGEVQRQLTTIQAGLLGERKEATTAAEEREVEKHEEWRESKPYRIRIQNKNLRLLEARIKGMEARADSSAEAETDTIDKLYWTQYRDLLREANKMYGLDPRNYMKGVDWDHYFAFVDKYLQDRAPHVRAWLKERKGLDVPDLDPDLQSILLTRSKDEMGAAQEGSPFWNKLLATLPEGALRLKNFLFPKTTAIDTAVAPADTAVAGQARAKPQADREELIQRGVQIYMENAGVLPEEAINKMLLDLWIANRDVAGPRTQFNDEVMARVRGQ